MTIYPLQENLTNKLTIQTHDYDSAYTFRGYPLPQNWS
jgi:hypothetical protein